MKIKYFNSKESACCWAKNNVAPEVVASDCPEFPVAGTARNCKFTQAAVQKGPQI